VFPFKRKFTLIIDDLDYSRANFTRFNFLLIKKCSESKSIADKLLGLETVARRIEESKKCQ